jgi:hypothetical protein
MRIAILFIYVTYTIRYPALSVPVPIPYRIVSLLDFIRRLLKHRLPYVRPFLGTHIQFPTHSYDLAYDECVRSNHLVTLNDITNKYTISFYSFVNFHVQDLCSESTEKCTLKGFRKIVCPHISCRAEFDFDLVWLNAISDKEISNINMSRPFTTGGSTILF